MNIIKNKTFQLSSLAIALNLSGAAYAEETQNPEAVKVNAGLEVIEVTAQKRSQNLQHVPIAIQSFNSETLKSKGISTVTDVADSIPNVELDYTSAFSGSTQVLGAFIRGIGQADFAFNLEPGVGMYIDGVFYARAIGSVVDLLDLEHIEVLKGPQGTLFGRNTIGGALNIVTRRPSDEFQYTGEITLGRFDRQDIRGAVDIPLTDNLYSQISFASKNRDGYHRRLNHPGALNTDKGLFSSTGEEVFNNRQGGENNDVIRAKLYWDASSDVSVLFSADLTNANEQSAPNTLIGTFDVPGGTLAGAYNACISGVPAPFCATDRGSLPAFGPTNVDDNPSNDRTPYDDRFITDDIDTTYGGGANYSILDSWGASATVDWSLNDDLDLKSISAYRELDSYFGSDVDGSPIAINDTSFAMSQQQWSQELQLTGLSFDTNLEWVAGIYYFHEEGTLDDHVVFGEGLVQIYGPNEFDNDAYAAFFHTNYQITDALSATVGLRYTYEDKTFIGGQRDLNDFAGQNGFPAQGYSDPSDRTLYFPTTTNNQTFSNVTSKLGLEYRVNNDVLTYVSYSEGFKSGGWTTRVTVPVTEAPAFDEETAVTYEIGMKSQWLDDTFRFNTAIFSTDYDDLQITVQRGLTPFIENAGKSKIEGIEADFVWVATENLSFTGAVGYIDAQYTELSPDAVIKKGFLFNNTPERSASLSAEYFSYLESGSTLKYFVDYSYSSEQANDAENTPELITDSLSTVNASLTFKAESDLWDVSFGVKNLTDERYIVSGFRQPGAGVIDGTYSRPREWYLTFRVYSE